MKIGGMGGLEFVIILVVIVLIFGSKNLPKLGTALGATVKNLREGLGSNKPSEATETDAPAASSTYLSSTDESSEAVSCSSVE